MELDEVESLSASVIISEVVNGEPLVEDYSLQELSEDDENLKAVLDRLAEYLKKHGEMTS